MRLSSNLNWLASVADTVSNVSCFGYLLSFDPN